jgi:hypothetical protein
MTLRTEPSDRDVRTRSAASRVDLGTRYVTVCVMPLVAGRSGGKLSGVFLQPIQDRGLYRTEECFYKEPCFPVTKHVVLLLCVSFLRVLVVLYLRVTCICVA